MLARSLKREIQRYVYLPTTARIHTLATRIPSSAPWLLLLHLLSRVTNMPRSQLLLASFACEIENSSPTLCMCVCAESSRRILRLSRENEEGSRLASRALYSCSVLRNDPRGEYIEAPPRLPASWNFQRATRHASDAPTITGKMDVDV